MCVCIVLYEKWHALLALTAQLDGKLNSYCLIRERAGHLHCRTYVCMYVCMYVRTYVCTYVCMYVCMCVCMYDIVHVCVYVE